MVVKRNNEISLADIQTMNPDRIIISPGPGSPDDPAYFGVCGDVITELGKTTPLLGVCLGGRGIAHFLVVKVVRANVPMHGKTSPIRHDGQGVYQGLPQQLDIMRYHSLMVDAASLPECLVVTSVVSSEQHSDKNLKDASLAGDEIMGIRHRDYPIQGCNITQNPLPPKAPKRCWKTFVAHP